MVKMLSHNKRFMFSGRVISTSSKDAVEKHPPSYCSPI